MMAFSAPSIFQVVLIAILPLITLSAPEFQFSFGRIQGSDRLAQTTQKPYNAYYGIPFAEPPVGQLRFQPPQPFARRDPNVIVSSSTYRSACSQTPAYTASLVSEDCLYLNIFTPTGTSGLKKVMVWIHGGGYVMGDATTYKPSRMVTDNDVIVVTTQYRLGAFGFLSSGPDDGNNGLRDQILAIQWVKDNIRQFGGDPDDITIFGESAGAGSVSLLSISPLAKGLFTKVIMQSGTALTFWSNDQDHENRLYRLAHQLGCSNSWYFMGWLKKESYKADLLKCLRTKTAEEIVKQSQQIPMLDYLSKPDAKAGTGKNEEEILNGVLRTLYDEAVTFGPFVDGKVVPRDPRSLMADKEYLRSVGALDRDYIVGCNNNELLLSAGVFLDAGPLETFTKPNAAAKLFGKTASYLLPLSTSVNGEVMDFLDYEYGYPRDSSGNAPLQGLLDVASDAEFVLPTVLFARAMTTASAQTNVYVYLFDHYPELTDPNSQLKGSSHGLDIFYEFDMVRNIVGLQNFYAKVPSPADGNLAEIFRGAVTTFAKTGNPSRFTQGSPSNWPRFDPKQEYFLAISPSPEVRQHMFAKRVALWTDFIFMKGGVFNGR